MNNINEKRMCDWGGEQSPANERESGIHLSLRLSFILVPPHLGLVTPLHCFM